MLTFEYRDKKGILHKWTKMDLPSTMREAMQQALVAIRSHSKAHYLTGPRPQKLGVVDDILRTSLTIKVDEQGQDVIGKIGTRIWYGRMWEVEGNPHVKLYKKRPFLRPAIADKRQEVFTMFREMAVKRLSR